MREDQDLARALAGFGEQLHVGSHDGAGARWRELHRVGVEVEVGSAATALTAGLHPESGHLPSEGDVNRLVRVQDEVKHVGYVLEQAVSPAATVADQQLCG
ncbi:MULTISPECIES: hypothetical protein [unclassified Streptomyces]|uniref:hypothetical protein n=1 Tax=unclassified Streptomyces TaxID=2593676 RepID=UPI00074A246B|nr:MULTISPECIES: hypothetical protein [unclassified Streptomyces]KUL69812.1 hypothetical protein ADL34_29535 [Streptomyces sp. NRRL WC-3605]KUL75276.1 hypothetical protein ADL33_15590 [Streptomyces sp. NRRL WC-3604]